MAKLKINFKGVESGGGSARVPEGDYPVRVAKVVMGESKNSGNPMLTWTWEITDGKYKGKKIIDRATLTPESLWKLKQILEGLGVKVPQKALSIDTDSYVGEECGVTIADREYNDKTYSNITDYFPLDDLNSEDEDEEEDEEDEDDDEEEEEPVAKKKAKKGKKKSKAEDVDEIDLDTL